MENGVNYISSVPTEVGYASFDAAENLFGWTPKNPVTKLVRTHFLTVV